MAKADRMPMTLLVDSREQRPWSFAGISRHVVAVNRKTVTLETGDYSVEVFGATTNADRIVIERKSLADFYGSVGGGRHRFELEMSRMASYGYAALVIEASVDMLASPNAYLEHPTRVNPKSALCSLIAWSTRFGVHLWTAPTGTLAECRQAAQQFAWRLLERWHIDHNETPPPEVKPKPRRRRLCAGSIVL